MAVAAASAPAVLKTRGRYYFANGFQYGRGGPDNDLGAIVWDVTGLPDTSAIKEVARIRHPEIPGGFHDPSPGGRIDGGVSLGQYKRITR